MKNDPEALFVEWLAAELPKLPVFLQVKPSPRVPGGISRQCIGIEDVLDAYQWSSRWTDACGVVHRSTDWSTTKITLSRLQDWLRLAVLETSDDCAFENACRSVISWGGGDRSGDSGAKAFIRAKREIGNLRKYFRDAAEALSLTASHPIAGIQSMNAMLIKVHALLATDGLPIYDSRVAGAAGTLVEIFARSYQLGREDLGGLTFPSTSPSRNVANVYPLSSSSAAIWYSQSDVAHRWSSAAVKLGQTMRAVLQANPEIFRAARSECERMHSFEASLFMMGADLKCFGQAFDQYPCVGGG